MCECWQATGTADRVQKVIKFYGRKYSCDTLQPSDATVDLTEATEYRVTASEAIVMSVYHGLQHYKMNLCDKCMKQVFCYYHSAITTRVMVAWVGFWLELLFFCVSF